MTVYLKQFGKREQRAFAQRLGVFIIEQYAPALHNHKLHGKYKNYRSINITGDIRLVFEVDGDVCKLVEVGTHSELYGQ